MVNMDDSEVQIVAVEGAVEDKVNDSNEVIMIEDSEELVEDPSGLIKNHSNVPIVSSWNALHKERKRQRRMAMRQTPQGDAIVQLEDMLIGTEQRVDGIVVRERSLKE